MEIFDLTMSIDERTPTFPGDPKQEIKQIATIGENGWNEKKLTFNSHFSTHIDAPFHMLENGKKLTDFSIETFMGDAIVIEMKNKNEPNLDKVQAGDIVFFLTGQTKKAYSDNFFKDNLVITKETAQKLINKKVKIVGIDSFSPDNEPFEVHKMFFKNEILIVENLVNLEKLNGKRFKCYIFPLKIQDADGAPCRVVGVL